MAPSTRSGRSAQLHLTSLRTCLINLPLSIHGPLLERSVVRPLSPPAESQLTQYAQAPQSLVVELSFPNPTNKKLLNKAYVGWTGMPSQVQGVGNQVRGGAAQVERVEMDPQFAAIDRKSVV